MSDDSANPVQEAFELMRESVLVHINKPGDDKPPCRACDCRARELALAVFWRWRCCHVPCSREKPCGLCAPVLAEIAALAPAQEG